MTSRQGSTSGAVRAIGGVALLVVVLGLLLIAAVNGCAPTTQQGNGSPPATSQQSPGAPSVTKVATTKPPGRQEQTPGRQSSIDSESGLAWVAESALPEQARDTLRLIDRGGPYPYDRDGVVFGNFEGLLPKKPSGYYREFTVKTPGSKDRGARRIVTGKNGEFYWTPDHYQSFQRIRR